MARTPKAKETAAATPPPKKKHSLAGTEVLASVESIEAAKGEGTMFLASKMPPRPQIPTGIFLMDLGLMGGIPEGLATMVYGPESSGKTWFCIQVIREFQIKHPQQMAVLIDREHTFDAQWAEINGVDIDRLYIAQPTCGEDAVDILLAQMEAKEVGLIIGDSIPAFVPKRMWEESAHDKTMGVLAALMGVMCSKMLCQWPLEKQRGHQITFVFVNQWRCVAEGTFVFTERGLVTALEATRHEKIAGLDNRLTEIGSNARSKQPGKQITLANGSRLTCGEKHPIMVHSDKCGWVKACDIEKGMLVALGKPEFSECAPLLPQGMVKDEDALYMFLGMWFSDGSIISTRDKFVGFTEKSSERMNALVFVAETLGWKYSKSGTSFRLPVLAHKILTELQCERGAKNKTVPSCIQGRDQWRLFLRGMFDSHIHPDSRGVIITVENGEAARKIHTALLGFGIHARLHFRKTTGYISVTGSDAEQYLEEIGFIEVTKENQLRELIKDRSDDARGKADVIPLDIELIERVRKSPQWKSADPALNARIRANLSQGLCLSRKDYLELCKIISEPPILAKWYWEKVSAVTSTKVIPMVDFDVPDGEAFIANGIVTHNTKVGFVMGDPRTLPGGKQLNYTVTSKIELKAREKEGRDARDIHTIDHNLTTFYLEKAKCGMSLREGEFKVNMNPDNGRGDTGTVDDIETVSTYAKKFDLIQGGGSKWYFADELRQWRGGETLLNQNFRKKEEIENWLIANPAQLKLLKGAVISKQRVLRKNSPLPPDGYLIAPMKFAR